MSTQQIPIDRIQSLNRMRFDVGSLDSLKEAMHSRGLLQGIGVQTFNQGESYHLLWGHRRLESAKQLGWKQIEAKVSESLEDYEASELEFMENWERKSMTWQEEVLGLARIHNQRTRKGALTGEAWGQRETGRLLGISVGNVNYTLKVAALLDAGDQEILMCFNMAEALRIMLRRRDAELLQLGKGQKTPGETYFKPEDIEQLNRPREPQAPEQEERQYTLYMVRDHTKFAFPGAGIIGEPYWAYPDPAWVLDREGEYYNKDPMKSLSGGLIFRDLSITEGTPFISQISHFRFYYNPTLPWQCHNISPMFSDSSTIEQMIFGESALADSFWAWFFHAVQGTHGCVFFNDPPSAEGICYCLRTHQRVYVAQLGDDNLSVITKEMKKYGSFTCINTDI